MIDYSNNSNPEISSERINSDNSLRAFFANVFTYMAGAMIITGIVAYAFGNSPSLMSYLVDYQTGSLTLIGYIVTFAPLVFALGMQAAFHKLSSFILLVLFVVFSLVMGVSLGFIFLAYTASSIASTFFITAATFGVMAVLGYTTKQDLTKFGAILYMAIIGIVITSIVNVFIGSDTIDFIISGIGVLVFTGYTAYQIQSLKRIGSGVEYGTESANKLSLLGALVLYINFVNLFISMLRFFGDRR